VGAFSMVGRPPPCNIRVCRGRDRALVDVGGDDFQRGTVLSGLLRWIFGVSHLWAIECQVYEGSLSLSGTIRKQREEEEKTLEGKGEQALGCRFVGTMCKDHPEYLRDLINNKK